MDRYTIHRKSITNNRPHFAGFFVNRNTIKIAVCGSASNTLPKKILQKARRVGEILAKNNILLFTGATTGYSYVAAKGTYSSGGLTIGISPAESVKEHVDYYQLPTDVYKIIIYTGHGYKARDIIMIRSVDAIILIGGGVGTLVELAAAIDANKVIGILKGSRGVTTLCKQIGKFSHRVKPRFIFSSDPNTLINRVIKILKKNHDNK
jgi:uncharacterized protein (TIGR00725 family)